MAKCFFTMFIYLYLATITILLMNNASGQANKVSPKLDFDDSDNKNNSDIPIVTGTGLVKTEDKQSGNGDGSGTNNNNDSDASKHTKSSPKIHGVRVTVDTGNAKTSKEAKESVEISDVGSQKKRVGIHTDITFEISNDSYAGTNTTSTGQDYAKEDASVPIFKGRSSGSTAHSRKPYDSKSRWNPNFSAERRSYDGTSRISPVYYYPQYYPSNLPIHTGSGDAGAFYRYGGGWNTYIPNNMWTTERTYSENYRPNTGTAHHAGSPSWKPCYCITGFAENNGHDSRRDPSKLLPYGGSTAQIDKGKLEKPFSNK